jgi:site-specific recombinase XerD
MNDETAITIYTSEVASTETALTVYGDGEQEEALIARWLEVKASKSKKTRAAYVAVISQFRAMLAARGLDFFADVRLVASIAGEYARTSYDRNGRVASGVLSESTINQRLAILSSFYTYAGKFHNAVTNPIALCEREKRNVHDAAQHLEASDIETALQAINRKDLAGKRDYALLLLALTTGRRASELTALVWGDLRFAGKKIEVTWRHCKGNKTMHDILGVRTRAALEEYVHVLYGKQLAQLANDTPLFVSLSRNNYGRAMSIQAVSDICTRYLGTSKVHATRHSFAVNLERAGASLSEIGERLGHSSLKTTSEYMKRLHSAENKHIATLESLYGL